FDFVLQLSAPVCGKISFAFSNIYFFTSYHQPNKNPHSLVYFQISIYDFFCKLSKGLPNFAKHSEKMTNAE
ncbi:MAG: hypothetical protein KAU22_05520, partial [Desulfuromonadales bacterium]|nr:hypothetical protein [Desulfuromonadales bacterium]